jgi:hypothetical protein
MQPRSQRPISPLPLDSPQWESLAPGVSARLVSCLDNAAANEDDWDALAGACASASTAFAVIPHLAAALARFDNKGFVRTLRIAAAAELCEAPAEQPAFAAALATLRAGAVAGLRERRFASALLPEILSDVAALLGDRALAAYLAGRQLEERQSFSLRCSACGQEVEARAQPEGLFVAGELKQGPDEVGKRLRRGAKLLDRAYAGLHGGGAADALAALAHELGEHIFAAVVVALATEVPCPACKAPFRLLSGVGDHVGGAA